MRAAEKGLPVEQFPQPPPVEQAAVPDVVGQLLADARKTLSDAKFSIKVVQVASNKPDGTVLSEDPAAGTQVEAGSLITLTVSGNPSGPQPTPTPSPSPSPSPTPSPSPSPSATSTKRGKGG
jgi:serine/threonine-protein kinase